MKRPLNEQKHCSWCGAEVTYISPSASECSSCKYKNYLNPKPCVNLIIRKGQEILFVKRSIEPNKGKFDLPGGFVDLEDKTIEETCYRELEEELGIKSSTISPVVYVGSGTEFYEWMDTNLQNLCFFFECQLLADPSVIQVDLSENSELTWVSLNELDSVDYAWDIDKQMLAKYTESDKKTAS